MKAFVIAEIGINHNGSLDIAKRLIDLAVISGCDAVKFQKRNPDVCVPENQKNQPKDTPWGKMTYLEYKKLMEFEKKEYDAIASYCRGRIQWSASPWDLDSLYFLMGYDVPFLKIPSAHLTNHQLIKQAADWCVPRGKTLILSTGMSTEQEISQAVGTVTISQAECLSWMDAYRDQFKLVIMHCNSTYPAALNELNLSYIKTLKEKYPQHTIGYSGHEFRLGTSVAAVYLGAEYIERHITLDRTMWGTDHLASVEPQGLIKLVKGIRELEEAYGDGIKKVYDSELPIRQKLRG